MFQKGGSLYDFFNLIYYAYKRNNWIFDLSRFFKDFHDIKINKPVFFLGTHGGGLTLTSRMIRRNEKIVSVTGNYNYWAGADEMDVVLGSILPFEFSGIKHNVPVHPMLGRSTAWIYAADEFVTTYRKTAEDVTPELKKKFHKLIRWIINRHAINKDNVQFVDKSQVYTLRVSFINEILKDSDPRFILITRNPYAMAYRAVRRGASGYKKLEDYSFNDKLELAAQHWTNSMKFALKDKSEVDNFLVIRFEDILSKPTEKIKKICDFIEIEFKEDMLPQPEHEIPFGCRYYKRWYPLRPGVNDKYLKEMEEEHVEIIDSYVHKYAEKFNYKKPIK